MTNSARKRGLALLLVELDERGESDADDHPRPEGGEVELELPRDANDEEGRERTGRADADRGSPAVRGSPRAPDECTEHGEQRDDEEDHHGNALLEGDLDVGTVDVVGGGRRE